jgi:hypothetical protein
MTNQERERIEALIDELENVDRAYASPYTTRLMMKKAAAQLRADHPARGERDETDMPWPLKLAALRKAGWVVAVHNDYRQGGMPMTFWLFTHSDGRWVKGEGATDHLALVAVFRRLGLMQMPPPVAQTQTEATPADPSQCARNPCVVAGPSLVVQAGEVRRVADVDAAARILATWIGYSWDGLSDRDISAEYPDWARNGIGDLHMQGGKPALRRVVTAILTTYSVPTGGLLPPVADTHLAPSAVGTGSGQPSLVAQANAVKGITRFNMMEGTYLNDDTLAALSAAAATLAAVPGVVEDLKAIERRANANKLGYAASRELREQVRATLRRLGGEG